MRRQRQNANRHTERGMAMLKQSVEQDGWIGAITVAANDETFDGSARLEVNQAEPIIIDSDGTRPIVVRRTDIGTASDPKAHRLGIAANRVAQANLEWDPAVLAELAGTVDLPGFWNDDELSALLAEPNVETVPNLDPGEGRYKEQYGVIVICSGEMQQEEVYNRLSGAGYTCRVVVT